MTVKIITPYVFEEEIKVHKDLFWEYDVYYERDTAGIGSDLMFQKMWNHFPNDDIFILHADMTPHHEGWFEEVLEYVEKYPEAGMFGCLLLYPARNESGECFVQCAGGKFTDNRQITSEVGWYLKTNQLLNRSWKLIQDNTIPREPSPGQHLEVATSEGNLSIPWAILTPPLNGHTTETSIIACLEDKTVTASIRYLYDSIITNQETIKD